MLGNRASRSDGFLAPRAWPPRPAGNQAEAPPVPSHSGSGQKLRALVTGRSDARDTPQTALHPERGHEDWRGNVVRSQAPLYKPYGWRDLIGAFVARTAKTMTVLRAIRYQGQLPMDQQPKLKKPNPWSDPTRGLP